MQRPLKYYFYRLFVLFERAVKVPIFDCRMCGQCIVRTTAFTCPMRCPKMLRNGPCGGAMNGRCETDPTMPCVWVLIHRRAEWLGTLQKLETIQPSIDWSLFDTASWINLVTGKIDIYGHPVRQEEKP
ncbi:MAG TPA: methylenetetrahydrofolate reductase C-terminal domain-containing protein [bacterium]|nr:methylenetetrahydrofolate reductase C-terminal domain-containing protein [bacterium]HQP98288.1 methylenetetrahydrofolate reductase C-terminal domain-containing protein [bacterium]